MTDKITERIKLVNNSNSTSKKEVWETCGLTTHQGLDDWMKRNDIELKKTTKYKMIKKQPKE